MATMPTSRTDRVGSTGFTLIEMLVVLAMLAVVAALIGPAIGGALFAPTPDREARQIASILREAQTIAIRDARETSVSFDQARQRLLLPGRERRVPAGLTLGLEGPAGARLADGRAAIRFFPDGSSTGGRIVVAAGARKTVVLVHWLTGRVQTVPVEG